MVPTNNFLPFCPTDTGSNLVGDVAYASDTGRTSGNVPGVARSTLNNKALRQGTYIASLVAQLVANKTGTDMLDDANSTKAMAQITAALDIITPVLTNYTSGSGTHKTTTFFYVASANATAAATYTNNGATFTVTKTIAGGVLLQCTGTGAPSLSGVLTKASGTGDASISFYAIRVPISLRARLAGGGGGGGSGNSGGASGGGGGTTSLGSSLLTAGGGAGGGNLSTGAGGAGGTASLGSGPLGFAFAGGGGGGGGSGAAAQSTGGMGGVSPFGGAGYAGINTGGGAAVANTGSGGGGGSGTAGNPSAGGGGGAGGYIDGFIPAPSPTYAYQVGSGGSAGTGGSGGTNGGAGAAGFIIIQEEFQ